MSNDNVVEFKNPGVAGPVAYALADVLREGALRYAGAILPLPSKQTAEWSTTMRRVRV